MGGITSNIAGFVKAKNMDYNSDDCVARLEKYLEAKFKKCTACRSTAGKKCAKEITLSEYKFQKEKLKNTEMHASKLWYKYAYRTEFKRARDRMVSGESSC